MKQIITLMIFCLGAGMLFAQPALKVASDSNVGIGVAAPSTELHVVGQVTVVPKTGTAAGLRGLDLNSRFQMSNADNNEASAAYLSMNGAGTNGNLVYSADFHNWKVAKTPGSGFGTDAMRLWSSGSLKIGNVTTAPTWTLTVDGTAGKIAGGEFSTISDRRLKKNISEFEMGLEQVLQINPVTFQYNGKVGVKNTTATYTGVIAQEYAKVEPTAVVEKTFNVYEEETTSDDYGSDNMKSNLKSADKYLTVDASNIKYMLVNAVKQHNGIIEDLKEENKVLRDEIAEIRAMLTGIGSTSEQTVDLGSVEEASLMQNHPNPFNGSTTISYRIPTSAQSAKVEIFSNGGQLLKTVNISERGTGELNVNALDVPSGSYYYTLTVDNKSVGTKAMIKAE